MRYMLPVLAILAAYLLAGCANTSQARCEALSGRWVISGYIGKTTCQTPEGGFVRVFDGYCEIREVHKCVLAEDRSKQKEKSPEQLGRNCILGELCETASNGMAGNTPQAIFSKLLAISQ